MTSYWNYKRLLFQNWSLYRLIFCQKNVEKRFIHSFLSRDIIIPQFQFKNRSYICTPVLMIGKRLFIKKYSNNTSAIFGTSNEKVNSTLKSKRNVIKNDDDIKKVQEISEFLTSINISPRNKEDINIMVVAYRKVTPSVIEDRYYCLKEMGFTKISIETLFHRYNSLVKETVAMLHLSGELALDVHPLDLLISTADVPPDLADIIKNKYESLRTGPVYSMHHAVMLEFLVWELNSSHQEILNIFKKYPSVRSRSFRSIKQMLKLLIKDVGLSEEKIKSNGFLLCLNSREVPCLLESLQELLIDVNVTELIKKSPVILSVQVEKLKKIGKLFQQYNITPQHIMKKGNIFTLSSTTIYERLKFLEETPELKEMKSDPRYLDLIFSYNKALKRMEYLKKVDLPFNLHVLCCAEGYFKTYVSSPEDLDMRRKVIGHLASVLKTRKSNIIIKIQSCNMSAKFTSVDEINGRIKFLNRNKVPKEDILNNLPLLFFSEQDLLKEIDRKTVVSSHSEVKTGNHSDVDQQNPALQALLDLMKSRMSYGRRIIEEQIDANEILQKL